jgi:response regulator of citrate/malate metabolism
MKQNSVLIVEDDIRIADILSKTINNEPEFDVIGIASSSPEAIDFLTSFAIELVFLDVSLTDSSGLELLKHIRQNLKAVDIGIVMVTAAKDADVVQEAMSYGAFDYILKPIALSRLKVTLQRYLQYCDRLSEEQPFEQDDLDTLFHQGHTLPRKDDEQIVVQKTQTLPKGIDSLTLDKIRNVLRENSGIAYTAESMSDCIGTSRTTARRYLEYLLSKQEISADIEYGSVGRPERNYLLK